MAKTRQARSRDLSRSVTADRVARLYRFIRLLADGPLTRSQLLKRLRINQRGFYRDMELLREAGIQVNPANGKYDLTPGFAEALDLLPFPDPQLTLGQAQRLARGSTTAHRALQLRVKQITSNSAH